MREDGRKAMQEYIETNDGYDYERWEAQLREIFSQIGIIRSLIEDEHTEENRERIIAANEKNWEDLLKTTTSEEGTKLIKAFLQLKTKDKKAIPVIQDFLGERARYATQMAREKAPPLTRIASEDAQRGPDEKNPTHEWLKGNEPAEIERRLSACKDVFTETNHPEKNIILYESIGALQSLSVILGKLREKIDEGEIEIPEISDVDNCLDEIHQARQMLVNAIIKNDRGETLFDIKKIKPSSIQRVHAIANAISEIKITST